MEEITVNGRLVRYQLKKTKRKSVSVSLDYFGSLFIKAPENFEHSDLILLLEKNYDRFVKSTNEKDLNLVLSSRRLTSGESIYLDGKQYLLKFIRSNSFEVEFDHDCLQCYLTNMEEGPVLMEKWLEQRIFNKFKDIVLKVAPEYTFSVTNNKSRLLYLDCKNLKMSKNLVSLADSDLEKLIKYSIGTLKNQSLIDGVISNIVIQF